LTINSVSNAVRNGRISPFGNLRIIAWLLAPRSLSQASTSFIGYASQGIRYTPICNFFYVPSPFASKKWGTQTCSSFDAQIAESTFAFRFQAQEQRKRKPYSQTLKTYVL